jgi:hypothetical protein
LDQLDEDHADLALLLLAWMVFGGEWEHPIRDSMWEC